MGAAISSALNVADTADPENLRWFMLVGPCHLPFELVLSFGFPTSAQPVEGGIGLSLQAMEVT